MKTFYTALFGSSLKKGYERTFWVNSYQPPWIDVDGVCIAPPDENYKHRFSIAGIHCSNEECAEWLLAIAGPGIVRLGENMFEVSEVLPAKTIDEWKEWRVGKASWELIGLEDHVTLYFHDFLKARLDAMAQSAKLEIDRLCALALQRLETFA